ncbi:MAG: RDD family protein [Cellvibrionaceae bacterium]
MPDTAGDTPPPAAGLFHRLAALFYDSLLLLGISACYVLVFAVWLPNWLTGPIPQGEISYTGWTKLLFQLGWLALLSGFFIFFWRRGGQTLGMRAWRLRLQSRAGGRISYRQALLRCLLAPLSLAILGLGYFWCLVDKDGQTAHDQLTGTETVRTSR